MHFVPFPVISEEPDYSFSIDVKTEPLRDSDQYSKYVFLFFFNVILNVIPLHIGIDIAERLKNIVLC